MAKRVHLSSAVLIGSLLHAGTVSALGLGEITLNSYLNEPLDAEVRLIDTRDLVADEIKVRLAGVDEFERLGVDRNYFLTRIQFEVSIDRDRNTGVIRLTTNEPVLEPFVDVIIEARWPSGRLLREYTVLVDPPVFREEPLVVSASEEVAAAEQASQEPEAGPAPESRPDASGEGDGDRVSTRRSELPAGEMPKRTFSSETAEAPAPGQRYMVRRDETLWQIASRGRPQGSSVQQAMLDIQRLNPEAFIDGNINRIKAGYIIYLPSENDISSDDLSEALAEVQQQNSAWASERGSAPGVTAAASLRISADIADDPADNVEDDEATGDAAARVADAGAAASDPASESETPAGREEEGARAPTSSDESGQTSDAAAGGAESELAGEIAAMAERLDTLEQIVALKDEQIAALEEALREARAAAEAPSSPTPAVGQSATQPAPAPAAPAAATSEGFGPWLYAVAGVLLAGLIGLLLWRRRRTDDADADPVLAGEAEQDDADDVFAGVTLRNEPHVVQKPPSEPVSPAAPETEPGDSDATRNNRGYGERRYDDYIDDADAGDALAEADIYIAYGRYLQAAELLNTAIESEPGNVAYRLKLIELYVDMGEPAQAREQIGALRELGDDDAVRRAEAILGGNAEPESAASEPSEPAAYEAPPSRSLFEADTLPEVPHEPEPDTRGDAGDNVDDGPRLEEGYEGTQDIEYEPLEFTLEDAAPGEESVPAGSADAAVTGESATAREAENLELELDFDELAIEEDGLGTVPDTQDDDLDLSDALREADSPEALSADDAVSDEPGSEDMVFAADEDQVATRLDLARAYLDMGDDDGARRILEQVVSEGSQQQQREAQALLDRIG